MTKLLIIGQAPGRAPGVVLGGRCGARLAALAGISLDEFLERTDRMNLLDHWPGKAGKGDAFVSQFDAREMAAAMMPMLAGRVVVLLGNGVSGAFGMRGSAFTWTTLLDAKAVAWSPHPSGISRWWNDQKNVARAASFWSKTFEHP